MSSNTAKLDDAIAGPIAVDRDPVVKHRAMLPGESVLTAGRFIGFMVIRSGF